ncbi:RNA polymerase recycling motor HelD [Clostridium senegalense]
MAIKNDEMILEKNRFYKTKEWITKKTGQIKNEYTQYEEKVANLKKASGGTYSNDLLVYEKLFKFTSENLKKYEESSVSPYFARIDFKEKRRDTESFYIGKFGINDNNNNEEVVIDWRAPIANLYYSGTYGESYYVAPSGVIEGDLKLKRKFLLKDGNLIDAYDEGVNEIILKNSMEGEQLTDEFLKVTLEQNVTSKLKDVVATIQNEQNQIIRAYKNKPIIIQGSAGSGKTTVALHRLAYLVYEYDEDVKNEEILVVAPNKIFLDYISEVLPNLGVFNMCQKTFEDVCKESLGYKGKIYTKDEKLALLIENKDKEKEKYIKSVSKLKGSLSFKMLLDKYIRYLEKQDIDVEDIKIDKYVLFSKKEIKRLYARDMIHLPIKKRKEEIERYFKKKLKDKIQIIKENIEEDYFFKIKDVKSLKIQEEEKRKQIISLYDERDLKISKLKENGTLQLKEFFKKWKQKNINEIYKDLCLSKELFNHITNNQIPENIVNFIVESSKQNFENKVIDIEDLAHMVYLKLKLEGLSKKYVHIIIDEAQDYSYFEMYILNLLSKQNSLTIVGDLGQGIYSYKGINDWQKLIKTVFDDDATYINLTQSYRSTIEIIDFANKVLSHQNLNIKPAKPVLRHGDAPKIVEFLDNKDFAQKLNIVCDDLEKNNKESIAIICKTIDECKMLEKEINKLTQYKWTIIGNNSSELKNKKIIIPSYMTKGLEFDATIIYNCNEENYNNDEIDKKLLYVNLTRALHKEYIFYKGKKSNLIK